MCNANYCFFKLIIQFCKVGRLDVMYKSRGLFLFKYAEVKNDRIFTNNLNVTNLMTNLMNGHFSYEKLVICNNCNFIEKYKKVVINLCDKSSLNIKDLQKEINNYFSKNIICARCKRNTSIYCDIGGYVTINIENMNVHTFLNCIPVSIEIKKSQFILVGLIGFENTTEKLFIAYTRRIKNSWTMYNSIKKKPVEVTKIPKVNITIIVFCSYWPRFLPILNNFK